MNPAPAMSATPAKFQNTVRWIAVPILSAITTANFYVSFTRLEEFIQNYGGNGLSSVLLASTIDLTALCGLFIALAFKSNWARAAFVFSLLVSGFANGFVGYYLSGWIGLGVGILPLILLEFTYRISLALILRETPVDRETQAGVSLPGNVPRRQKVVTPELAKTLRNTYAEGNHTQKSLAEEYGVSVSTVSQIIRGKTWIPDTPSPEITLDKTEYDRIIHNTPDIALQETRGMNE